MHCLEDLLLESWVTPHPDATVEFKNTIFQTEFSGTFRWVSCALGEQFLSLGIAVVPLLHFLKPRR
jgi:hypothetical protein